MYPIDNFCNYEYSLISKMTSTSFEFYYANQIYQNRMILLLSSPNCIIYPTRIHHLNEVYQIKSRIMYIFWKRRTKPKLSFFLHHQLYLVKAFELYLTQIMWRLKFHNQIRSVLYPVNNLFKVWMCFFRNINYRH